MAAGHGKPARLPNTIVQREIAHQVWIRQEVLTKQQILDVTSLLIDVIKEDLLQNKRVQFRDFGTLYLKVLSPSTSISPVQKNGPSIIASRHRYKPAFNPAISFCKRVRENTDPSEEEIKNAIKKRQKVRDSFKKTQDALVHKTTSNN